MKGSKRKGKRGQKRAGMSFAWGVVAAYLASKIWQWHIWSRSTYYQWWYETPDPNPPAEFVPFIESVLIQGASIAAGGVSEFLCTYCTPENIWNMLSGGSSVAQSATRVVYDTVQQGDRWISGYLADTGSPRFVDSNDSNDSGVEIRTSAYRGGRASSKPTNQIPEILREVFRDDIRVAKRKKTRSNKKNTKGKKKQTKGKKRSTRRKYSI